MIGGLSLCRPYTCVSVGGIINHPSTLPTLNLPIAAQPSASRPRQPEPGCRRVCRAAQQNFTHSTVWINNRKRGKPYGFAAVANSGTDEMGEKIK